MAEVATLPRPAQSRSVRALAFWYSITSRCLRQLPYDLSARQMGILMAVYLEGEHHSIKTLSENLGISKPAVCRAVDVLERLKFVRRARDKEDKRNVLIQRTVKGSVYLSELADIIVAVLKEAA